MTGTHGLLYFGKICHFDKKDDFSILNQHMAHYPNLYFGQIKWFTVFLTITLCYLIMIFESNKIHSKPNYMSFGT